MATTTWIKNMLQQGGVAFEELHHSEAFTAQEVAQREHITGHRVAKVVVVMADGKPVELVLPASRRVELERVRQILGSADARMASEKEMERYFTDCEVGAVPPLPHWENIPVLMDSTLRAADEIVFQAGTHEDAVRLRFSDWYEIVNPRVDTFTEPIDVAKHR